MKIPILIIAGPTASGKTGLSVALAKKYNGEIISADSMQIYKGMDVGTAKPDLEERMGVPHHLMDVVEPWEGFTVAQYRTLASQKIKEVWERGKWPIVVGGTGLYIHALIRSWTFSNTPPSPQIRRDIETFLDKHGKEALYQELLNVDPDGAKIIHPNNVKRVIRALEVYRESGRTKSSMDALSGKEEVPYDYTLVGLTMERARLYARIEERIDRMMEAGLVAEVKKLVDLGGDETWQSMQGLGYKEVFAFLKGQCTLDEAVDRLKKGTRHYAKRQWTWFRRLEEIKWLDMDRYTDQEQQLNRIMSYVQEKEEE